MEGVDSRTLQMALDWSCGLGQAIFSAIQPGESFFRPKDVMNHVSYAFDNYYPKEGKTDVSCNFQGVAMITTTKPSNGDCIFLGSLKERNGMQPTVNSAANNGASNHTSRHSIASYLTRLLLLVTIIDL